MLTRLSRSWRAAVALSLASLSFEVHADPLSLAAKIELPRRRRAAGPLRERAARDSLLLAAVGANTVEVIDLGVKKRESRITAEGEPQGRAFAFNHNRLFIANGESGTVQVLESARVVRTIKDLPDAGNLRLIGD